MLLWSLFSAWFWATAADGQQAQVVLDHGPYYINNPVVLRIVVSDFEEQPPPVAEVESSSPGVSVVLASVNPQVSSSVRIVTDPRTGELRRTESKDVLYTIFYRIVASKPGDYTVGPFLVKQNGKQVRAQAVDLSFQDVSIDPDARVRLVLPEKPLYPDQRVPVSIEFGYAGDFRNIGDFSIYSPLFDQFNFAPDARPPRNASILPVQTKEGRLGLAAQVREEEVDGRPFAFLTATRTMIPERPGEFELEPISANFRKVTKWARSRPDPFGFGMGDSLLEEMLGERRRAVASELVRAVGKPRTIRVQPFPAEGRPESFTGAVGSNFSLDVTAARTEVRVGDPITFTLTLRGDGNIKSASLPPLSSDGGMDPDQFRLPNTDVAGQFEDGAKKFDVTVRVMDETVKRVPALAYSWFDPEAETYRTTHSKPIALNVMPAKIVSSSDVFSNQPQTRTPKAKMPKKRGENAAAAEQGTAISFTLTGADLSIEQDPALLFRDSQSRRGGITVQVALYAAGLVFIGLALLARKRSDVPAELVRRRQQLRRLHSRIEKAARLPQQQAAEEIAAALRGLVAEMPQTPRGEIDAIVVACEGVAYAPNQRKGDQLDASLHRRALAVADQVIKEAG
jgi:hypothetical protein